jgi:hypothetical protein
MPFVAVNGQGNEIGTHANYAPAEAQARNTPGGHVVYEGVRGQSVLVWPLPPLEAKHEAEPGSYNSEPYL